jgi:hypothetical protein
MSEIDNDAVPAHLVDETTMRLQIEHAKQMNRELCLTVERTFYSVVRAYRAQGITEPQTYRKALDALNNAVKPFNEAYRA